MWTFTMVLKHKGLKCPVFLFRKKKDRKKHCFSQSDWGREEGTSRETFRIAVLIFIDERNRKENWWIYLIHFLVLYTHLENMQSEAFCNVALDSNCTHTYFLNLLPMNASPAARLRCSALWSPVQSLCVSLCVCQHTHVCVCAQVCVQSFCLNAVFPSPTFWLVFLCCYQVKQCHQKEQKFKNWLWIIYIFKKNIYIYF